MDCIFKFSIIEEFLLRFDLRQIIFLLNLVTKFPSSKIFIRGRGSSCQVVDIRRMNCYSRAAVIRN